LESNCHPRRNPLSQPRNPYAIPLGNPTIADAVLDRLVHGSHRLKLSGESIRKLKAAKAKLDQQASQ
jgi:hypothetical protein